MPGVRLTLSEDAMPSQPTILITQDSEGAVAVNVLGVHSSQGLTVAALLHDIASGLERAFAEQPAAQDDQLDIPEEAAHSQHLDAENARSTVPNGNGLVPEPPRRRPPFAPHS